MIEDLTWLERPPSSASLRCVECGDWFEVEIRVWSGQGEDHGELTIRTEVDYQPWWDHTLFKHMSLE